MSETKETKPPNKPPVAKRSWIERTLAWSVIVLLLAVVALEWTSRRGYETTLDQLDTAIRQYGPKEPERAVLVADLGRHVRGFAFRGQYKSGAKLYETFRWPSLFRFYKLIVLIDAKGIARTVDAFTPPSEAQD